VAAFGTTATTTAGSGCMNCLNKSGVWCSRTYAYLSLSTDAAIHFQADSVAAGKFMDLKETTPNNLNSM